MRWIIAICSLLWAAGLHAEIPEGGKPEKRDTLQALVLYGEEVLFETIDGLDDAALNTLLDSLLKHQGGSELTNSINLYLSLKNKTEAQLIEYIDSLFETEDVPYALINQINLYLANRPEELPMLPPKDLYIGSGQGEYPAMDFYPNWVCDKPNPYGPELCANDTSLSLLLVGTELLGEFHSPVDNLITSKFGWRDGRMHNGIDIDLEVWDPVVAAFPGVVRMARSYGGYGRVVIIRHYNGLETVYAHLHRFKVKEGDVVAGGQVIGLGGSSGHSTGSHLHFEVRFKGIALNPMSFISFDDQALVNDTLMLRRTKNGYLSYPKGVVVHTVKKGDTLYDIARSYGTTTYRLAELNGIRRNQYLVVGQRLRVI